MSQAHICCRVILLCWCATAWAEPVPPPPSAPPAGPYPVIVEIAFDGNDTTQAKTMRRELVIDEGQAADPDRIERSRQAIQDLGLFRRVEASSEEVEGGVRVIFRVRERYYILPYPRLSANLDGQTSLGGEVDWNNMFGLNYSLRVKVSVSDQKEQNRGKETSYTVSFGAPFFLDSRYSVGFVTSHSLSPVTIEQPAPPPPAPAPPPLEYDETFDSAELVVSRKYSQGGPASQGWTVGAGARWENESRAGTGVPEPYGEATAPIVQASYYDIRDRIFSSEGISYGARLASAHHGIASDYNYTVLSAYFNRLVAVGTTAHQDVNFFFGAGSYFDGPPEIKYFSLGGSGALRARNPSFIEGNAYYLLRTEYLRPIGWPWLRGALILEAGNTFEHPHDINFNRVYTSLGAALRLRLPLFVNLQVEVGYAIPLNGGPGRVFGGRI